MLVKGFEMLQGPRVVLLCLTGEKREGDTERALAGVNADHIKKWHSMLICFVGAIQYQDVGVALQIYNRVWVGKEDSR